MPNSTAAKNAEARQKQSEASKRATLDQLVNKPRNTTEFSLYLSDGNGGSNEVTLKYQAIGMRAYDDLVAKHPPKADQRQDVAGRRRGRRGTQRHEGIEAQKSGTLRS